MSDAGDLFILTVQFLLCHKFGGLIPFHSPLRRSQRTVESRVCSFSASNVSTKRKPFLHSRCCFEGVVLRQKSLIAWTINVTRYSTRRVICCICIAGLNESRLTIVEHHFFVKARKSNTTQSSLAIISSFDNGLKLSISKPCSFSVARTCGGTSLSFKCGAIDNS